ncbi:MAG: IPT/TIG domain-containing protein [Acidobacteriota bacterium]|nr:IPT/TIG domain-containing protein [Blastocatellia bacterium]MDW8411617.1 IPT/TIG domain-containing protein [Acidobacteriota bacterium]
MKQLAFAILVFILLAGYQMISTADTHKVAPEQAGVKFKDEFPVVNEGNKLRLSIVDSNGQTVPGYTFESGSPEIASVDPATGEVTGVAQGYATITARSGSTSISTFVTVTKVENAATVQVTGASATDRSAVVYLTDPINHVILRKDPGSPTTAIYAGKTKVSGRSDGARTDALFAGPIGIAVDNRSDGGVYIADTLNHSIRLIGFDDQVITIAGTGTPGTITADSVPLSEAVFKGPRGVAVDKSGLLYVADTENHAIYVIDRTSQTVKLLAGNPGKRGKADGKARSALFDRPASITISTSSSSSSTFSSSAQSGLLVADTGNDRIRFVSFTGQVTTVGKANTSPMASGVNSNQGNYKASKSDDDDDDNDDDNDGCDDDFDDCGDDDLTGDGDEDGDGYDDFTDELVFDDPISIVSDESGNFFIVDDSEVSLILNIAGQNRIVPLAQRAVTFNRPRSLDIIDNQVLVLDSSTLNNNSPQALKKVTVGAPTITSLSRSFDKIEGGAEVIVRGKNFAPDSTVILGDQTLNSSQYQILSATEIRLIVPPQSAPGKRTLTVQTRGGIAQTIFSIAAPAFTQTNTSEITTLVGGIPFLGDGGLALSASLQAPTGLAFDSDGFLYVADSLNRRIRRIEIRGKITSIAGNGNLGSSGDGGSAIAASFILPTSLAIGNNSLYIADHEAGKVRSVDLSNGVITTVAGNGNKLFTSDLVPARETGLDPAGIALDTIGNLYIADKLNNRIRRVDAFTGIITTIAGNGNKGYSGDGAQATAASLNSPSNLAFDRIGRLYIVDQGNHSIRMVDPSTGVISTIAGNGKPGFTGDGGDPKQASLNFPSGICFDRLGNLLIADTGNARIRIVNKAGDKIATLAGNGNFLFQKDNVPPLSHLRQY